MLDAALLGTSGMMPMPNRFLSSLLLRCQGQLILLDCGEGTQVTLKMLGWGFKAIDAILFTHYHADHISGLPGMLLTIGNAGRTAPLRLFGPRGLKEVVEGLRKIAPELPFEIVFEAMEDPTAVYEIGSLQMRFLPVEHLVPCFAYRFDLKRQGRFDVEKAKENHVPRTVWSKLQKGEIVFYEGKTYTAEQVLGKPRKGISISFCTDTRPTASLPDFIAGSDLFVCEGMYGEEEKREKAYKNKHMLFSEAASLAAAGGVKQLWLTHFSPSMADPAPFFHSAADVFSNTVLGYDRMTASLSFPEESADL